jgi:hypothetical protein
MDWIRSHRKAIVAAIAAVLVLVVDSESADRIAAAAGAVLTYLVPND